jgi:hypothetical protein
VTLVERAGDPRKETPDGRYQFERLAQDLEKLRRNETRPSQLECVLEESIALLVARPFLQLEGPNEQADEV